MSDSEASTVEIEDEMALCALRSILIRVITYMHFRILCDSIFNNGKIHVTLLSCTTKVKKKRKRIERIPE